MSRWRGFDLHAAAEVRWLRTSERLRALPLSASPGQKLDERRAANAEQRRLAARWNRCGGLLGALAGELQLEIKNCLAVLAVESGGAGFAGEPRRLVIRFENHVFYDRWAEKSEERRAVFARHFRFDSARRWTGHLFRADSDRAWQRTHSSQDTEWQALALAQRLDCQAALCSISMGAPQIMGFHFALLGYASPEEMFAAFGSVEHGEREQLLTFFDFLRLARPGEELLVALRRGDLLAFARGYNGPGQAAAYAARLQQAAEELAALFRLGNS
jgi:hypothetical protein